MERLTKKLVENMTQWAKEQIAEGETEEDAVGNAVGGIFDEFDDDYFPAVEAVANKLRE